MSKSFSPLLIAIVLGRSSTALAETAKLTLQRFSNCPSIPPVSEEVAWTVQEMGSGWRLSSAGLHKNHSVDRRAGLESLPSDFHPGYPKPRGQGGRRGQRGRSSATRTLGQGGSASGGEGGGRDTDRDRHPLLLFCRGCASFFRVGVSRRATEPQPELKLFQWPPQAFIPAVLTHGCRH